MSTPPLKAPKGTRDLVGAEAEAFARLEHVARGVFRLFGFSEVRTPIFEPVELFSRSLGETSDVVEKEMFTFTDRGERMFALRPEGTAGVVRYFIENNLGSQGGVHRLFYMGPMFRAERPQAGRYRQFWQIGSEYFGSPEPAADADTVVMISTLLRDFGLQKFSIHVNSIGCGACRPRYREALVKYLQTRESELTEESKRRMKINPLRVLDSKVDGPKLTDAPIMKDFLCEACARHHDEFLKLIRQSSETIEENPRLVRGLDYYTRSVFEFVSPDLGAQSALAAGGRYDDLVQMLGGPSTPGVGFALGMDRVVSIFLNVLSKSAPPIISTQRAVVIPLDEAAIPLAFSVSQELRRGGVAVPPVLTRKKLKNQLSLAVDEGANWAILIGEDEMKQGELTIKNLETREQTRVKREHIVKQLIISNPPEKKD